jgi:NAD(P)H-flavin reductase
MDAVNHYHPLTGIISDILEYPFDKKVFRIAEPLAFIPGQFVEVSLAGIGEFPVSITSPPHEKRWFEIGIKKLGKVTSFLFTMAKGSAVGYRGPFGNGFPMEKLLGEYVVVIAGGLGILPLRSFIKEALYKKSCSSLTILYGAHNPDDLMFIDEFDAWRTGATVIDVCERGRKTTGRVTDFIECASITGSEKVVMCGPPAMFEPAVKKLREAGIGIENIFVSLERRMKCGVGTCGHCLINGERQICREGPVLPYTECIRVAD